MKKSLFMLLAIAFIFSQCDTKTQQEDQNSPEDSISSEMNTEIDAVATIEEELTEEQKLQNMYKNATSVIFNVFMVSYNDVIKEQAKTLTASFGEVNSEKSTTDVDEIDAKIENFSDEFQNKLDSGLIQQEAYFNQLKTENVEVYNKMFTNETMKEGLVIAEHYEFPAGFGPLHKNMDEKAIARYVVRLVATSNDKDDVVNQYMSEVMQWYSQVNKELEEDPEINEYLESLNQQ